MAKDSVTSFCPSHASPAELQRRPLNDSKYRYVWQVLNAIKSHDDRFEAEINQLALTEGSLKETSYHRQTKRFGRIPPRATRPSNDLGGDDIQGSLHIVGDEGFQDAIRAKVVDKYADPAFWEKWATTIREIANAHENRIRALLRGERYEGAGYLQRLFAGNPRKPQ